MRIRFLLVTILVLALRLPFLNQAIQGDDDYYLAGAEHAQVEPLHPLHTEYPFLGRIVDMRGHPHPPLDAWCLGALLAWMGTVSEVPYHAAYILFSLLAAWSALSIARRFTPRPLAAAVLFLATPAFIINGNSLESDIPFLAFWLASIALFLAAVERRSLLWLGLFVPAAALAGLAAYQSIVLTPLLWLYLWLRARDWKLAWIAALSAPATIGAWQIFERVSTGVFPAAVLAGYMRSDHLEAMAQRVKSAVALTGHLGWVVFLPLAAAAFWNRKAVWLAPLVIGAAIYDPHPLFWLSIGAGLLILLWCGLNFRDFTAAWVLIFFAASVLIFFAGAARYLLPLALPLAILVSKKLEARWVWAGAAGGFALGLLLAVVNYQHWDGYRQFAASLRQDAGQKRVWINGEWGLRFYLEREGALSLLRGQKIAPGDVVVSSALAYPIDVAATIGQLREVSQRVITSAIPLRLVSLGGKSAYSTTLGGLRPFDISTVPMDRVNAAMMVERKPTVSYLPMNAPEAAQQIVSGIYGLDGNAWRWMSGEGVLALKSPDRPQRIEVKFVIPAASSTRGVSILLDGREISRKTYAQPGTYTLETAPIQPAGDSAALAIVADKTFRVPPDRRDLSVILTAAGFQAGETSEPVAH